MANTEFYQKAKSTTNQITWKDIFSEFRAKHTKRDMEYAFLAGTSLDRANEADMLSKWRKPWLFWRVFLAMLAVGALSVAAYLISVESMGIGINEIICWIIVPMIVPLTLTVFFWELNIPRNISIYEVLGYFVVGAILSLFATQVMIKLIHFNGTVSQLGEIDTWLGAPVREEPGKLAASIILLLWASKKQNKKIYGITGLVIGAAVGTGFSVFESILYSLDNGVLTALMRMLFAAVGHTMFCAPYTGAVALHMKGGKLSSESFLNIDFGVTFASSALMHLFWNSRILGDGIGLFLLKAVIVAVVLWGSTLFILRKSLRQVLDAAGGGYHSNSPHIARVGAASVSGVSGCFAGRSFSVSQQGVRIGRDPSNDIVFPQEQAGGISRTHCIVRYDPGMQTFTLIDQGSSYGTFLGSGAKLTPGMPVTLRPGDTFYLASSKTMFRVTM